MSNASGRHAFDLVAFLRRQRIAHAAGHGPGGMHALAAQQPDHLLAELAQADAAAGDAGIRLDQPHDVARGRIAIHAQQQIGRAEVEEAQRVALDDLAPVHQPAQLLGARRDAHAQDVVAGFGGGQDVADRADAADARGDAGHLPEAAPDAELLEAAELNDVKTRVCHLAVIAQHERDLGVALDAGYGIDGDCSCHQTYSRLSACCGSVVRKFIVSVRSCEVTVQGRITVMRRSDYRTTLVTRTNRHTAHCYPNFLILSSNTTGSPASSALTAAQMRAGSGGQPGINASTVIT